MSTTTLSLILLLPLAGFTLLIFFGYRLIPRKGDWLATSLVGVSAILSVSLFAKAFSHIDPNFLFTHTWQWIDLGDFRISMGFLVDNLTVIMLTMVTVSPATNRSWAACS